MLVYPKDGQLAHAADVTLRARMQDPPFAPVMYISQLGASHGRRVVSWLARLLS